MKKIVSYGIVLILLACVIGGAGCESKNVKEKNPDVANEKEIEQEEVKQDEKVKTEDYIQALVTGLTARWKAVDGIKRPFLERKEVFRGYVELEVNQLSQFENKTFEDTELQNIAEKYMVALENQLKACEQETEDEYNTYWKQGNEARELYLTQIQDQYDFISKITEPEMIITAYEKTNREFSPEPAESISNLDWEGLYNFNDPNLPMWAFYIGAINSSSDVPCITLYETESFGSDSDLCQGYIMNNNTLIFPYEDKDQWGVRDKTLFLIVYRNDNGEYFLCCSGPRSAMSGDVNAINIYQAICDAYSSDYYVPLLRE